MLSRAAPPSEGNQGKLGEDLLPEAFGRGGKRPKQTDGAFSFFKKKKSQQVDPLHQKLQFVFHVHTKPTWALVPGQIRDRCGVIRVIAASSLSFFTKGFHLFRERMILFKTELEIKGGEGN